MSGRISIGFIDFAVYSFAFDRIRCVLVRSFLVRNWCAAAWLMEMSGVGIRNQIADSAPESGLQAGFGQDRAR
jgi:hypothetical protein